MADIPPGPLSRTTASRLNAHVRRVRENQEAAVRLLRHPPERSIPVMLTDYDAGSNTYSGYEQAFAADGTRYEKPGGRTFAPEWSPIYGIGDENNALTTLPAEATVRFATVTATKGPVYEVMTVCGCVSGTIDGGGGGEYGGSVVVPCCPGVRIPRMLTGTWVVTSGTCTCLNGQTVTFVQQATHPVYGPVWNYANVLTVPPNTSETWCASPNPGNTVFLGFNFWCAYTTAAGPTWQSLMVPHNGWRPTVDTTWTSVCSPFSLTLSNLETEQTSGGGTAGGACPGARLSLVITE